MKLYQLHIGNRILIVDDEEFCISAMKVILEHVGINLEHQLDFCISGKECLDQIKDAYRNKMSYKVIFTDFSMPVMGGIESTILIRKFLSEEIGLEREE